MKIKRLRKKTLRQARREKRRGRLTDEQYQHILDVCEDEKSLAELNDRIENEVNPWNRADGLIGAPNKSFWSNVWDWFVANWPKILNIIMTIAPLLLLEPRNEDQ